ncbi:MAG: UDP binding domain-containing protein [Christensenellaceae bacterium]
MCTPCNKTIAILGLAFKPNTDDMRESAAISMVQALYDDGLKIKAYDPQAMKNAQEYYFNNMDIYYAQDEYDAIKDADAIIILTEWEQFGMLDFDKIKQIAHVTHFFDYRNMYQRKSIEEREIWYAGVGV